MSDTPHSQEDAFGLPPRGTRRRYYFDIDDGQTVTVDEIGLEIQGIDEVHDEACRTLGEIAKDNLPDGSTRQFRIAVRDDQGRTVLRASLALSVEHL